MKAILQSKDVKVFKPYQFIIDVETIEDHRVLNRFLKRGCAVRAEDPFEDMDFCKSITCIRGSDAFIKNDIN